MANDKAREVWQDLNDRQRFYLESVYNADQAAEAEHRANGAAGIQERRPAAEWRQIDAYHEPSMRDLLGTTALQVVWEHAGYHSQGNGSTIAVLVRRALVLRGGRATRFGEMHTLTMTSWGRAVVRAGLGLSSRRSAGLSERSAEVLGQLYAARSSGKGYLDWGFSRTIERFIVKRPAPLARYRQGLGGGYEITDAGAAVYERSYSDLSRSFPHLVLPDPTGRPDPWPAEADRLLERLSRAQHVLRSTVKDLREELAASEKQAADPAPKASASLTGELKVAWHSLKVRQARERAELARTQLDRATPALDQAVAAYVGAALAAVTAVVHGDDVVTAMAEAGERANLGSLPPLTPTGVDRVDLEASRLYELCTGAPKKRARGRAPRVATGWAGLALGPAVHGTTHEAPLALAKHLTAQLRDGYLQRRLDHAAHPTPAKPRRPRHLLTAPARTLLTALASAKEEVSDVYHEARRQAAEREQDPDLVAAIPLGLLRYQINGITRSQKAIVTLLDRQLIEQTDVAPLLRFPGDAAPQHPWLVYSITEQGRAHLTEHHDEYGTFYPELRTMTAPDPAPDDAVTEGTGA